MKLILVHEVLKVQTEGSDAGRVYYDENVLKGTGKPMNFVVKVLTMTPVGKMAKTDKFW